MVARDVIRKRTLSAHPEFDGKKEGADRYGDPHVGSTVTANDAKPESTPKGHVAGTSSADPSLDKKKG